MTYSNFLAVCALKINSRSEESKQEEVSDAFRLFTRGKEGPITL